MAGESRPALRLVHGRVQEPARWLWFCGYCAARWQNSEPPRPVARVCRSCGLGLLLHAREDAAPGERDAFLVVDQWLRVQAFSRCAETLLGVCEEAAVQRPVGELLVCADAQAQPSGALADAIVHANADSGGPVGVLVRPAGTFGLRMRGRIAGCGPPRAALVVLQNLATRRLRAVS
jgi:hypothetical protein